MASTLRIKRRLAGGSSGAPSALKNAELAFSEVDDILYYGKGDAAGEATSIIAIGGLGAVVGLTNTQTISGGKTFSGTVSLGSSATASTPASTDSSTAVATTAYVKAQNYLTAAGAVTSVALSLPNIFSVSGSPVTTTGTLSASLTSQTAATVFAAPAGTAGTPSFRSLVAGDIPSLTASKISDFDAQVRTSRLDQMAAPTAAVSLNGQRITSLGLPQADTDATSKSYVDALLQGLDPKQSVVYATTAPLPACTYSNGTSGVGATLTASSNGALTIDGFAVSVNDRVLIKDQASAAQNGVYVVTTAGDAGSAFVLTRATDFNTAAKIPSSFFFVEKGNSNKDIGYVCITDPGATLGTTDIVFTQFSGAGSLTSGDGLVQVGNTINVVGTTGRIVVNPDSIDLASGVISATGTYRSVTVDTYGRVTAGTNPTTLNGYGITDAQPLDATLTALAGVTTAANTFIYATGIDTFSTAAISSFGRSLVADVDNTSARTTLGLGTMAVQNASSVNITGGTIDGITFDGGTF